MSTVVAREPEKKIDTLRALMRVGDWRGAMKLAASFARLGDEDRAIRQAWEAFARPGFYRQIGKDPKALIAVGVDALRRRYPEPVPAKTLPPSARRSPGNPLPWKRDLTDVGHAGCHRAPG